MQKTTLSPLTAGGAAQVAEIRDAEADLTNPTSVSVMMMRMEKTKQPLLPLKRSQFGSYPRVSANPYEMLQYRPKS